jgi:hypothetical protein
MKVPSGAHTYLCPRRTLSIRSEQVPVIRPPLLILAASVLSANGTSKVVIVPSGVLTKAWTPPAPW